MTLLIIIVCIAVYWKTLEYNYCIDDWQHNQELLKNPQYLPKTLISKILSSLFESKFIDPKIDHAVSIFIHTLNSVLIYYSFGILPALLFAVHAAATQGSVWVAGRGYAKATMFILLMFTFKWLAPVFYWFAAPGFNAMFSPVVFLYSGFWFWILLIPLIAVLQGKNLRSQIKSKIAITPSLTRKVSFVRLPLYFKTLGYYFVMGIFPWRLGVYHSYCYCFGLSEQETKNCFKLDRYFWVGVAVMYVLIMNLIYNTHSPATFGLFWFVALISQWCNFPTTINQFVAERYLYLPLIGLMVFLVNVIMGL